MAKKTKGYFHVFPVANSHGYDQLLIRVFQLSGYSNDDDELGYISFGRDRFDVTFQKTTTDIDWYGLKADMSSSNADSFKFVANMLSNFWKWREKERDDHGYMLNDSPSNLLNYLIDSGYKELFNHDMFNCFLTAEKWNVFPSYKLYITKNGKEEFYTRVTGKDDHHANLEAQKYIISSGKLVTDIQYRIQLEGDAPLIPERHVF